MSVLVPNCKVFSGGATSWKGLCEELVAWCKSPGNLQFMTVTATDASSGSDDRVLLRSLEGDNAQPNGQIWIGYTSGGEVGFLLDPEETLSTAEEPVGGVGSLSHLRANSPQEGNYSGKFIFIEYPDAFLLMPLTASNDGLFMAHGGRTLTCFNASDAAHGRTGHALFVSSAGASSGHTHIGVFTPNGTNTTGRGFVASNQCSVRIGDEIWAGSNMAATGTRPKYTESDRPTYPVVNPLIIGNYSSWVGYTRYARSDETDTFIYGNMRVATDGDQAWVALRGGSNAPTTPWWLWDRRVAP